MDLLSPITSIIFHMRYPLIICEYSYQITSTKESLSRGTLLHKDTLLSQYMTLGMYRQRKICFGIYLMHTRRLRIATSRGITKECDTNHHPSHRRECLVAAMVMERTARNCEPRARNPDFRIELAANKSTPSTAETSTNSYK